MRTPNIPQKKIDIMQYVWGESEENLEFHSTTLESHIYALRKSSETPLSKHSKALVI